MTANTCDCLRCLNTILNPDPCQCANCIVAAQHDLCPFNYGYNTAMREALTLWQESEPIYIKLENSIDYSQERIKAKEHTPP